MEFNLAAGFSAESVELLGLRAREEIRLETGHKCLEPDLNGLRLANLAKDERIEIRSDLPFDLVHKPIVPEAGSNPAASSLSGLRRRSRLGLGYPPRFRARGYR